MAETTTIVGNIGQEPVLKTTAKGDVLEFRLAQNSRRQVNGEWVDAGTTWYTVAAWGRLAANAAASLHKGQPVIVRGDFEVKEWTGQDGAAHYRLSITARDIGHDLALGTAQFARSGAERAPRPEVAAPTSDGQAPAVPSPAVPQDWGSALGSAEDVPF